MPVESDSSSAKKESYLHNENSQDQVRVIKTSDSPYTNQMNAHIIESISKDSFKAKDQDKFAHMLVLLNTCAAIEEAMRKPANDAWDKRPPLSDYQAVLMELNKTQESLSDKKIYTHDIISFNNPSAMPDSYREQWREILLELIDLCKAFEHHLIEHTCTSEVCRNFFNNIDSLQIRTQNLDTSTGAVRTDHPIFDLIKDINVHSKEILKVKKAELPPTPPKQ